MNFAWAPDNEWDYVADLTGDATWSHENMRRLFIDVENCTYVSHGTPGHGSDGYIQVSSSVNRHGCQPKLTARRQVKLTRGKP